MFLDTHTTMKRLLNYLSKRTGIIILCGISILALFICFCTLSSPKPKSGDDSFSAKRAYHHLHSIAHKQHSVFDTLEIENIRIYLQEEIDRFEHIKWERVKHHPITGTNQKKRSKELINIHNIYAEIPGQSGSFMLLVAHYDSSPYKEKYGVGTDGSFGAADDGYGITTLLEIMRLLNDYAASNTLVNGVKFAFTDAEEVALGGAIALIKEHSHWLRDVSVVLNLEARGNKGPLYMFQTSDLNNNLIKFYSRTHLPFSFSVAADVYHYLPNDTDFTPFIGAGFQGLNFATLNNLKYYHTPEDNLHNADMATIQFYGEQIFPLVLEYINNPLYSNHDHFISKNSAVFFTLFPGFLIHYSQTLSWIFILITSILAIICILIASKKRAVSPKKILLSLCILILFLLCTVILGYFATKGIGALTHNRFDLFYMPYVPFDYGFTIILALLVIVAGFYSFQLCLILKCSFTDFTLGVIILFLFLTLISAFILHGATYLFQWPTILMIALLIHNLLYPLATKWQLIWKYFLSALSILIVIILYTFLIYSLFLALTFGSMAIILLFVAICTASLVPTTKKMSGLSSSFSLRILFLNSLEKNERGKTNNLHV